uniref:Uncharacterized protein n=1 Tax=Panagrolaimus superbus TaxID=310955 RepID=A0A914YJA5_9BILA
MYWKNLFKSYIKIFFFLQKAKSDKPEWSNKNKLEKTKEEKQEEKEEKPAEESAPPAEEPAAEEEEEGL